MTAGRRRGIFSFTMEVSKVMFRAKLSSAAILVPLATAASGGPLCDSVVELVFRRRTEMAARIQDLGYFADYRYVEEDLRAGSRSEVACTRRVWMMGFGRQRHDFETVTLNGRPLAGAEMDREVRDLRRKGLVTRESRMPFFVETRREFTYSLSGVRQWQGRDAWVVSFEPRVRNERTVRGRAIVLEETGDIVRMEFTPARMPFVVDSIALVLDYAPHDDLWLPASFRLDLMLRLTVFRRTLLDRHISIDDRYSDYKFNNGLTERFFEGE